MTLVNNKSLARKIEAIKSRGTKEYIIKHKEMNPAANMDYLTLQGKGEVFCTGNVCFGIGFGLNGVLVENDLNVIEDFIRKRKEVAHAEFELTPFCDPLLLAQLQERNYTFDHFLAVWVVELENWQPKENRLKDEAVTVAEVSGEETYEWAWTVALGISRDNTVTEEMMESTRTFLEVSNTAGFLLKANGESIAGATIAIDGKLGELFLTSTVKAFRGRGFQNLLIEERLRYAKEKGCSHVTVTTQPDTVSARNMERNGFKLMYNKAVVKSPRIH
ncbi:GNAT family N-acetyltransferase [Planococcus shenhongbingii]|uniref:GNAT family N-acetyltransferase n=1 Tax=Planococcus shenhongbingii TaxID=3058398 RepID=UPI002613092E|nr:GNAT family N-acetyltransferase [Planococcus sp. N016]WKA57100.1 GNAT family N-acetyltransferase [Planococcus sp. N016]